jgi:2,4-dienoyl-CoA reductase-like NADH-dependent reductase (Old Yellow Enzyme family)
MTKQNKELFQPYTFRNGITVPNRIAMAPMTTWASNDDYTISADEVTHYAARIKGIGLVITGCTRVTLNGIGFTHEYASYDDSFLPSLKKLAAVAKSGGAPAILQIYHAGNKAIAGLIPGGDVVSASAIEVGPMSFVKGQIIPRQLIDDEVIDIIKAFGQATRRAIEASFDGVEIHGAHGFLLQNFFSPIYNQRNDDWGGSAEKRMRFPLEVVKEIQEVIEEYAGRPFLLGYRISPEEQQTESYKLKDIYPFIDELIKLEIDYLHASLSNVLDSKPIGLTEGKTIAELLLEYVNNRVPVIAFTFDTNHFKGRYKERQFMQGKLYHEGLGVSRDERQGRREANLLNYKFYNAPHAALLFMPSVGDNVQIAADIGMYAQTFLLSLTAHGLEGVPQTILGFFADIIREHLAIPDELKMMFGISFGYGDKEGNGYGIKMARSPIEENVTFHN